MWEFNVYWLLIVFFSHFFIDKFSLAKYYLFYIKGSSLKKVFETNNNIKNEDIIRGSFTTLVYTVVDNTLHILLMWGGYNILFN